MQKYKNLFACMLLIIAVLSALFLFYKKDHKLTFDLTKAYTKKNLIPVAVIGSGPAGLSAAIFTARAKFKTIVFAGHEPGGTLNQVKHIENWPGKKKMAGSQLMKDLENQAREFGAEIINETIKSVDFIEWPFKLTSSEGTEVHALAIIIATGGVAKKLEVPGVEEYWGKGIGSCAICDAPFNKDQDVIVVGGSDPAADVALQLAAYAKKVTMITPENNLQACATVQDYLKAANNVEIITATSVEKVLGDGTSVTAVALKNVTTDETSILPTKAIYFGIGHKPISNIFKPYIQTDSEGYIIVQCRSQKTSLPGVFAAGTVEDKIYGKAAIASGHGVTAALDALSFLETIGLTPYLAKNMEPQFYVAKMRKTSDIKLIKNEYGLNKIIDESPYPVIIDYFASYCPSCIHMMPILEAVAAEMKDKAIFVKVDVDKTPELAKAASIYSLPTLVILKDGKEVSRNTQINSRETLLDYINPWVSHPLMVNPESVQTNNDPEPGSL